MVLIFGGAYQGKLDFAKDRFSLGEDEIYTFPESAETESFTRVNGEDHPIYNYKCVNKLHRLFLTLIQNGQYPVPFIEKNLSKWRDKIVICGDISSGVVPLDPCLRQWREETGRSLVLLSQRSDEVYRVFCGIGTRLK